MSFENVMNAYAARHQLAQLDNENNKFMLTVDDRIDVACFQANGRFYAYSTLTRLSEDNSQREELLARLMEKNLGLLATQRVSLCIDPDDNSLAIYVSAPLKNLSVGGIEESIAALANNYELFLQWVGQSDSPSSDHSMMLMP